MSTGCPEVLDELGHAPALGVQVKHLGRYDYSLP